MNTVKWSVLAKCNGCGNVAVHSVTTEVKELVHAGHSLSLGPKGTCPGCEGGTGIDEAKIMAACVRDAGLFVWDERPGRKWSAAESERSCKRQQGILRAEMAKDQGCLCVTDERPA